MRAKAMLWQHLSLVMMTANMGVSANEPQKPIVDSSSSSSAQDSNNPLTSDFAEFARTTLEAWKVPGLSIAVIDGDKIFAEVCLFIYLLPLEL